MGCKYSVIIPIYNAESTINRCVESLLVQKREDVEILLVNDGSTDETDRLCRVYVDCYTKGLSTVKAAKEPVVWTTRVRHFTQENKGVSSARNVGLRNARGRYVLFVDSDDYVEPDLFERLDELLEGEPDLLCLSSCFFHGYMRKYDFAGEESLEWGISDGREENGDGGHKGNVDDSHKEVGDIGPAGRQHGKPGSLGQGISDNGHACYQALADYMGRSVLTASSAKVFKRELIQKYSIEFPEYLRIAEDSVFLFAYLLHIRSFRAVDYVAYYACTENPNSLSRGRREYLPEQLLRSNRDRLEMLEASDLADEDRQVLRGRVVWSYYRAVYSCGMELLKFDYSGIERRRRLRAICGRYLEDAPSPVGGKGRLIALPIRWKLVWLIDLAALVRVWVRRMNG